MSIISDLLFLSQPMSNPSGYPAFEISGESGHFLLLSLWPHTLLPRSLQNPLHVSPVTTHSILGTAATQISENTVQILLLLWQQSHFTGRKPKSFSRLMWVLNNPSTYFPDQRPEVVNRGVNRTVMVAQRFLAVAASLRSPPPLSWGHLPSMSVYLCMVCSFSVCVQISLFLWMHQSLHQCTS